MLEAYALLAERALRDEPPSPEQARRVLDGEGYELLPLLHAAYLPRERHFGRKVMVHVLNNVQSGHCSEDCGYCSQSRDSRAAIHEHPMKSDEEIFAEAQKAARAGASRYCMALAGRSPSLRRTRKLAGLIRELKRRYPIEICLSAGMLDEQRARILAEAGLDRLNHNLNTSASHYRAICSTHDYADRLATLTAAKRQGLKPCSGLILGMGESSADAVEVAFALRELEVPSIPVNFLIPIEGNPVLSDGSLTPERCLRALAMMRLVNPRAEVRVAGGREGHLRGLQALALWPANSLFVEGYLTTRGDAVHDTYRMIREAGFEVEGNELSRGEAFGESCAGETAGGGFRLAGGDGGLLKPEMAREE